MKGNQAIEKIDSIVGIKSRINQLQEEQRLLTSPQYHDHNLIKQMYQVFCNTLKELKADANPRAAIERCKFSLLMMLLYNPSSFAGGRLKNGLRDRIAEAAQCQSTIISHDVKSAIGYIRYYRNFREDVNFLYNKLCETVREEQ